MGNEDLNVTEQFDIPSNTINTADTITNVNKMNEANSVESNIAKVTVWTKLKNALLYEVKLELTPKQEKVFGEVRSFWNQDIKEISKESIMQVFTFRR